MGFAPSLAHTDAPSLRLQTRLGRYAYPLYGYHRITGDLCLARRETRAARSAKKHRWSLIVLYSFAASVVVRSIGTRDGEHERNRAIQSSTAYISRKSPTINATAVDTKELGVLMLLATLGVIAMHAAFLLFIASFARASPLHSRHILDRRDAAPSGFVKVARAPSDTTFEIRIQLTNSDITGLEDRLKIVSSPSSSEYGKWLTREEVNVFVAPTQESLSAINAFLATHNLVAIPVSPAGDIVAVNVTVAQANSLFDTEYYTFMSTDTGDTTVRTLEYSIPASLKGHLSYIHPTTIFPTFQAKSTVLKVTPLSSVTDAPIQTRSTDPKYDYCKEYITPACIEHMYGLPTDPATAIANANDSITVTAYDLEYVQKDDLKMFLEEFRPDVDPETSYTVKGIAGAFDPQGIDYAGVEADLDVEYAIGLATDIPLDFVSVGFGVYNDGAGGFYATAQILAAHSDTSHVVTTSYGGNEDELTIEVAQALCNTYLQLSAMGITVIFSSGDGGVSGGQSQTCTTFVPTFPSGCPYVLSVGATQYNGTEVAAEFSSGGFSNIFPRPWYQEKEVSSYLKDLGDTYTGLYNASGRGFPDVAAIGHYAAIAYADEWALVDGTSVSAPVFAATIAILNDKLLAAGKPTLGFIQPLLYENPHALTDIKYGNNPGCDTDGFSASSGWDPVTGLGVPDFDSMMKAIGFHK
ncbi:unnamed protein product [Peniophora sp. CBMAI 1063]|nr:unnamed protein product [Peniophora sp. CBMAI 1063]